MEPPILVQLFVLYGAARLAGEVFERLRQPPVIGELLAGLALGAGALGIVNVAGTPFLTEFAELGAVVLLFQVGLETPLGQILTVGKVATLVAIAGVALPFAFGYGLYVALGQTQIAALFLGAALVATSVGVTARVLSDLGVLGEIESTIILGAAVIDDVLGLLVLSVVAGAGGPRGIDPLHIAITVGLSAAFLLVFGLLGSKAVARGGHLLERPHLENAPFALAVLVCLGMAALAQVIGLAAIVGAFLAGMAMAEKPDHIRLEKHFEPVGEFLVPFFFVITGASVDPGAFLHRDTLRLAGAVLALAIVSKLIGCGLGAHSLGRRSAAVVGAGMVPRGEVGIIVANAGARIGAVSPTTFAVIIAMSVITTLVTPPVLKLLFAKRNQAAPAFRRPPEPG